MTRHSEDFDNSGVYTIRNMVTGEHYIGSSLNIWRRWMAHKNPSAPKQQPNHRLYQDMQKYGIENFKLIVIALVEPENLKKVEQECIELFKPAYNTRPAYMSQDVMEKRKAQHVACSKARYKRLRDDPEYRRHRNEYLKHWNSRECCYNGKRITFGGLIKLLIRQGIEHPTEEAKKYLMEL